MTNDREGPVRDIRSGTWRCGGCKFRHSPKGAALAYICAHPVKQWDAQALGILDWAPDWCPYLNKSSLPLEATSKSSLED